MHERPSPLRAPCLTLAIACLGVPLLAQDGALPEDRATGAAKISTEDMRAWLGSLTSEECAGRGTGTEGFRRAAHLVRDHFRALGLEPAGDDGTFLQKVPWKRRSADPTRSACEFRRGDELLCRLVPGNGLHGQAMVDAQANGDVVLVVAPGPEAALPDTDLTDTIAVVWAPQAHDPRALGRRLRTLRPAAWIVVHDGACAAQPSLDGTTQPGSGAGNRAIAGRNVRPKELFAPTEAVAPLWQALGQEPGDSPAALPLPGVRAALVLRMHTAEAPAANVVGILRGSDPALRDEYVMVASHLDHLGDPGGIVHPGADDDGSGTAAVMALAQAFTENPVQPRRSVVFGAFCGEERGLLGSDYFAKNPPFALQSLVAELQLDMIGRSEENAGESAEDNLNVLHLIGTKKLSYDLHQLCVARNERAGFELEYDEEDVFYRSDHLNFARRGVPVAFFFTGFHRDYHKPTDTVEKIDFPKLRRVTAYVYDIAFELAMADDRPQIDASRWQRLRRELKGRASREPAAPLKSTSR